MDGADPGVGQLWLLQRDDVSVQCLVVQAGPGDLVVWPAEAGGEQTVMLRPCMATGVAPKWAVEFIRQLLPVAACEEMRRDHRYTEAVVYDMTAGQATLYGRSPWDDDWHELLDRMKYLGARWRKYARGRRRRGSRRKPVSGRG